MSTESSSSPPQVAKPFGQHATPPAVLTEEMAFGIQDSTKLFIRHGLGMQRLKNISNESVDSKTLVPRWQMMMEAFIGTQLHVLAGMGYPTDEKGLGLYNQQLGMLMHNAKPDIQERLRVSGRDIWRDVLSKAFDVSLEDIATKELGVVEARNVMHKVAEKMQQPEILEIVAKKCAAIEPTDNPSTDIAQKHNVVQEVLVNEVYLGKEPTLVSECGFGKGEKGYVFMQCVMAEHQNDTLVAQYIGSAMMRLLQSAGIDMAAAQRAQTADSQ
eukprot:CAMPEP_0197824916 /NCGR_PEP_ID=MMETSP1437-20131217/2101_1 /TAXON_ID=49252 ORGANISM="Eucampia antarctica, Strain CCMP1452" /NCGR_SAMPLE_ID=MMETSP1437 /ASSEMBLY_ACC=CAM_ASM_001096 /LENGTH=270 /DNA_ID=CAMNT_0043424723 /DNA_START=170 /DNA_END=982 /DNA_ORIENTATION=+